MSATTLEAIVERLTDRGIHAAVAAGADTDMSVGDVEDDHRRVQPGALFCCVSGATSDGHDHAREAVAAGAVALLCARPLGLGVPEIVVDDVRNAIGPTAALVHGDPSVGLCCVGITGTNGKTTTAMLLAAILRAAGRRCEVIGTLTGVRTTPEAAELQRTLARLSAEGTDAVVMEVSSHALAQHRVDGIHFDLAIFTNLSRDHLDFHGSTEEYFRAKARLFEPSLSARGVVNTDDPHGRLLRDAAEIPVAAFALADAEPIVGVAPIRFTWHAHPVEMTLAGRFNIANALAAASGASVLGIADETIREGLADAPVVPGRFEAIAMGQDFTVLVDFAHTPDGLEQVISSAAEIAGEHRVLVVFGAGGERDRSKRPLMGAAASKADVVVITNDNPRSESPTAIADEILGGVEPATLVEVELDRRRAIASVLTEAQAGDVVVVAGKGHETTQTIGTTVEPFDDREVVRDVLAARGRNTADSAT